MLYRITIVLQHLLQRWLTQLVGWGAEHKGGWLTYVVITLFVRFYKVDMQEALQPDVASYPTFNEFFIRALNEDARPIDTDPSVLVLPADGMMSQLGPIDREWIFQAKGYHYSLEALLAGHDHDNDRMIDYFRYGSFATTYISPKDYHRLHMPCNGILRKMIYVPGNLFSVNPSTVAKIPNLFARNERVICLFDTDFGSIAQILIGATIVGSIETVWSGTVTPPREGMIKCWHYPKAVADDAVVLLKGQEMGRFKLGSTVINLFAGGKVRLVDHLHARNVTRVGQPLAYGVSQLQLLPLAFNLQR
ncbi:phosphatidylserine decarboxylase [Candidatus Palibaumannia cicadellinicola]|uniref:Phosphatidylserine decarboxylase proenzyme n=1 Tax=Candidatus Palibaumannia cicadellinicola TaxID=186490 RepID=A0A2N4XWG3_9GAMM|nr:archaetidylserine decarboxylase [Candidatus Baumannia cicadellinicola]PLK58344.1 phosphatidylserine decarboxylase [Candidatus Baumannia cicadellinicola]